LKAKLPKLPIADTALRDQLAGLALQGMLAHAGGKCCDEQFNKCETMEESQRLHAKYAYGYADAMLKARRQ
jgi:hypothetical protein